MASKDTIDMMQLIRDLAYTRFSGTPNDEIKCKDYLADKFKALGVEPSFEPVPWSSFPTNVLIKLVVTVIFCGMTLGWLLEWFDLALINLIFIATLLAVVVLSVGAQQTKIDSFATMGKLHTTYNIFAKLPAQQSTKDILFVAHHDTKSQKIVTFVRVASYLFGLLISLAMGLIFIISAIVKLAGVPPSSELKVVLLCLWFADLPFLVVLLINKTIEGKSIGSFDNATGMAIVLKLLEHYKANPDPKANLWFLITGAEEWGMNGAVEFWKRHGSGKVLVPDRTFVFNYDSVAQGINFIGTFGLPKGKPYNKRLNDLFEKSASELGVPASGWWLPMLGTTDGWIFRVHGCEIIDIITRKMSKLAHSEKDNPTACDAETLADAVKLTIATVKKLEAD